jgi:murein endopeptidase
MLRVDSRRNRLLWDTLSVAEKVPNLQPLGDGANYIKVGGTCEHYGPSDRGTSGNCQTHDHNHWGTAALVRVVQAVADSFSTTYPGYRLRVNDMSLPNGGKFEVDGSWSATADHQEHRKGTNADITLTAYNRTGGEVSLSQRQRTRLWDLISHLVGRRPLDESDRNHYHIQ